MTLNSLFVLLALLITSAVSAQEDGSASAPPSSNGPVQVLIGFNLVNITDVSEKDETIDFEGAIYMEWMDSRLAYEPEEYGMTEDWISGDYSRTPRRIYVGEFAVVEEFAGWQPQLVIPNGIGDRAVTNMAISIWPDGRVAYSETFYVKAETPMDLRRFPFDTQRLEVFFHPFVYHRDELILVPDNRLARTWDQNLGIVDWSRDSVTMQERPAKIAYFDDSVSEISEFFITITISRKPAHMLVSILFPMALLVALTWCVFWMDEESLSDRINITFIGILSVVAYYFVILANVPETDYLTFVDAFVTATFLILAAAVVMVVILESVSRSGRPELGASIDRMSRWGFPTAYVFTTVVLALVFLTL